MLCLILAGKIEWPRHLDKEAKDLIKKLLVKDGTKMLGSMKRTSQLLIQIKAAFQKPLSDFFGKNLSKIVLDGEHES